MTPLALVTLSDNTKQTGFQKSGLIIKVLGKWRFNLNWLALNAEKVLS